MRAISTPRSAQPPRDHTLPPPTLAGLDDPALTLVLEDASHAGTLDGISLGTVLRHVTGRRVTLSGDRGGQPVVVKAFASPRARGNDRRLRALHEAGLQDLVPRSLAVDPRGHVGIIGFAPGRVLDTVDDATFVGAARPVGAALARLHGSAAPLDRTWTWRDEATQLLRRVPAYASDLARAATVPVCESPLVPSHRDFHPRQVVLDVQDAVHLIDLDDAALAPAGLDVGNMVAHLRREAVLGRHAARVVEAAVAEFLAGYGDPPAGLETWTRLALVRLVGLAESRHHDLVQRDALAALVGHAEVPHQRGEPVATGHADRPVRVIRRPDGEAVVVKRYLSADGAAVHEAMHDLWDSRLGAGRVPHPGLPRPLGYDVGRAELTMEHLPGDPLARRGDLGRSLEHAEAAAGLLADLHASGVVLARSRSVRRLLRSAARKVADQRLEPAYDAFVSALARIEEHAARVPDDEPLVPSHGDFSPRNVLVEGDRLALIDFDRLQMAPAARDVAYWTAWLWTTATLADHQAGESPTTDPWSLGDDLVAAYRARAPWAQVTGAQLGLHRALALLRIAHGWSVLRSDDAALRRVLAEVPEVLHA